MNDLPEQVHIGPCTFTVRQDEAYEKEHEVGSTRFGELRLTTGEIWIRPGIPSDLARVTLLHEVIHGAYLHALGTLNHPEKYVAVLAPTLTQVLQDNPSLTDFVAAR